LTAALRVRSPPGWRGAAAGGIRRGGDRPADDEIVGAGNRSAWRGRHHPLLVVVARRMRRPDAGDDQEEPVAAIAAQGGDLVRRADDAVEPGPAGEGGEATRLIERRPALANAGEIGGVEGWSAR